MNIIRAKRLKAIKECPAVRGANRIARELGAYLADESRTTADPVEVIFFPENTEQLCSAVKLCAKDGKRVSLAGARTGIVGGAVPVESQAVISLENMNQVFGLSFSGLGRKDFNIRVGAGLVLSDLQEALRNTRAHEMPWADDAHKEQGLKMIENEVLRLFYPVDPTEVSAQIGGTIATNASGARSYYYGATRDWVEALKIVTASGDVVEIRRGECIAEDGRFVFQYPDGDRKIIDIPDMQLPETKNTAGYYIHQQDMDAVDLFVGSEGTLGIIAEAVLRLTFEPAERLFANVFLPQEAGAVELVQKLRLFEDMDLLAVEYLGPNALRLLQKEREKSGASSGVPQLPQDAEAALYIEIAFDGDAEFKACCKKIRQLIHESGGSLENTWAGLSRTQMRAMKQFRHAVPEAVNTIISTRKQKDPAIHKIGTDMAVPDRCLRDVLALYREELENSGLEHLIFGHIGDNHLHVNILPASAQDVECALGLYEKFAKKIVSMGGSVSAEHGIGRIKRKLLLCQFTDNEMEDMLAIKRALDPSGMLNQGVIF